MKHAIHSLIEHVFVLTVALLIHFGCSEQEMTPVPSAGMEIASTPIANPSEPSGNRPNDARRNEMTPSSRPDPTAMALPTLRRLPASTYENALRELFGEAILKERRVATVTLPVALELNHFDNNAAVDVASPALVEAYHNRALAITEHLLGEIGERLGCVDLEDEAYPDCMTDALSSFARRAWRRPLTADERTNLAEMRSDLLIEVSNAEANALMLQVIIQSPHFLYYPEFGVTGDSDETGLRRLTSFELAARMAAFLWDSIPDEDLLHAAESGALNTVEDIRYHARRMLADDRAKAAVQNFYRQLLEFDAIGSHAVQFSIFLPEDVDQVEPLVNDTDYLMHVLFPAMRAEAVALVDREVFHLDGTLGGLLSSHRGYVTRDTANIYGTEIPEDASAISLEGMGMDSETVIGDIGEIFEVDLDPDQRAGFLTTLGFLSSHSKPLYPSPVERGVYVLDRILCNKPAPPPDQVPDLDETAANMEIRTNRDRYAQHSSDPACAGCHTLIDGVGFPFENYDTLGDWRDTDNGYPIDATGELLGTDVDGPVTDAVELIHALAGSRRVHNCHVINWSRYALGRSTTSSDEDHLQQLQAEFWDSQGNIQSLLVNLVASPMFRNLKEVAP